jgi:hypothetical protein
MSPRRANFHCARNSNFKVEKTYNENAPLDFLAQRQIQLSREQLVATFSPCFTSHSRWSIGCDWFPTSEDTRLKQKNYWDNTTRFYKALRLGGTPRDCEPSWTLQTVFENIWYDSHCYNTSSSGSCLQQRKARKTSTSHMRSNCKRSLQTDNF